MPIPALHRSASLGKLERDQFKRSARRRFRSAPLAGLMVFAAARSLIIDDASIYRQSSRPGVCRLLRSSSERRR